MDNLHRSKIERRTTMTARPMVMIDIAPYGHELHIAFNLEDYLMLRSHYTDEEFENADTCTGVASDWGWVHVVGVFKPSLSVLIHELAHVAIKVLEYSGVPINNETSEAYTYLLDHLVQQTLDQLKAHNPTNAKDLFGL